MQINEEEFICIHLAFHSSASTHLAGGVSQWSGSGRSGEGRLVEMATLGS
jgi:hypothetical protein